MLHWLIKNILTVHSPLLSRKIVEIKRFKLRAAILDVCQNYLGVALNPNVHPLGTYKTKMAFHTSKRSILTILGNEKIGNCEQKNQFNEDWSVKSIIDY